MNEADKILEMIENVDSEDTGTLDEIDARVWCFLAEREFTTVDDVLDRQVHLFLGPRFRCYTRSRDALKSIRPEGYGVLETKWDWDTKVKPYRNLWSVFFAALGLFAHPNYEFQSPKLLSEELAELHAIIQAIQ